MQEQNFFEQSLKSVNDIFTQPTALRSVLILIFSIVIMYWISTFVARLIVKIAQAVAAHSDTESNEDRVIRLRQVETYLSVTIAIVRVVLGVILGIIVWRIFSPTTGSGIAAVGAGTLFVVFAGQSIGILLRDLTAGATMIIEKWFNVGDYIKVEPFGDVSGVVERFTLRSTRIRNINGEVIWIHNQQIMAVHVTPRGVRTVAVDVFTRDKEKAEIAINTIIKTVPTGPTLLARPLKITQIETLDSQLWRLTITGETPPGREWLIEQFFVNSIKELDQDSKVKDRLFIHDPIARYADPIADKRFKRAVRVK